MRQPEEKAPRGLPGLHKAVSPRDEDRLSPGTHPRALLSATALGNPASELCSELRRGLMVNFKLPKIELDPNAEDPVEDALQHGRAMEAKVREWALKKMA